MRRKQTILDYFWSLVFCIIWMNLPQPHSAVSPIVQRHEQTKTIPSGFRNSTSSATAVHMSKAQYIHLPGWLAFSTDCLKGRPSLQAQGNLGHHLLQFLGQRAPSGNAQRDCSPGRMLNRAHTPSSSPASSLLSIGSFLSRGLWSLAMRWEQMNLTEDYESFLPSSFFLFP